VPAGSPPATSERSALDAPRIVAAIATWGSRAAWLAVAVVGGPAIGDALADHPADAARALTVGAWAAWAVGAMALIVPSVVALTTARVVVPAALAVAVATLVGGAPTAAVMALAVPAGVASVLVLSADVGRAWVQASAYGDEQRFPLRPPLGYLAATTVTWLAWTAAVIAAAVAWSDRRWPLAAALTLVAVVGAVTLPRRWHQLSQRWLVFVPAGLVVRDPVVLGETLMLPRRSVAGMVLAEVRPDRPLAAADLTGPTAGTGVEVSLHDAATVLFPPRPGLPKGRAVHVLSFVVAPSRPGAVLNEAGRRRLPGR
jgi:hypothetical protein